MGRIRVLPDNVANKIAAGEVVERPASVVKELLENSLDAGADRIRVEVEAGGKRRIRVTDNGSGMGHDDALLAFERHATSKLRQVEDLDSIVTLGFRGEALPSIASVSRLLLETRSGQEPTGTRIEIAGGKILGVEENALASGTSITVKDLFFNVPARRKFLRTEPTELAHIASLVTHYSLAHIDKAFYLAHEKGQLLNVTPVPALRERVFQVFGRDTLDDLVELKPLGRPVEIPPSPVPPTQAVTAHLTAEPPEDRTLQLSGFVSKPHVQKLNRNSIYIFVNRRLIRDRLLLRAISSAYYNITPPGTFPFALLFLDLPFGEVDVNVHPSKTEVRFRHQSQVHDFVRDGLRQQLIESKPVSTFAIGPRTPADPQPAAQLPYSEATERLSRAESGEGLPEPVVPLRPEMATARLDFGEGPPTELVETLAQGAAAGITRTEWQRYAPEGADTGAPGTVDLSQTTPAVSAELHSRAPLVDSTGDSLRRLGELRPLGQIKESFIVAAGPDGLWIIDQHVAHERILFEKVLRQRSRGLVESQRLLMPIILSLQPDQEIVFAQIEQEFRANGFDIEPFGRRTIAVKACPAGLSPREVETLVQEILDTPEKELRDLSLDDLQRRVAATIACHAAIKVNTPLDAGKMQWLLAELAKTDCPMSCPHGRPIALKYSLREILKAFHRT